MRNDGCSLVSLAEQKLKAKHKSNSATAEPSRYTLHESWQVPAERKPLLISLSFAGTKVKKKMLGLGLGLVFFCQRHEVSDCRLVMKITLDGSVTSPQRGIILPT